MDKNTIIAFTVTILLGLAAVTFCFLTYQKYLTIKVFQGEQITTNEGQILVKIDEYFRDDVSNNTVKYIAKTIEKELFKGADSEIEHLVKDLVHKEIVHKMKGKMKNDDDDFKSIGLQETVSYLQSDCKGCRTGGISTKACVTYRTKKSDEGSDALNNWAWISGSRRHMMADDPFYPEVYNHYMNNNQAELGWSPSITTPGPGDTVKKSGLDCYNGGGNFAVNNPKSPDRCQPANPTNPPPGITLDPARGNVSYRREIPASFTDLDFRVIYGYCEQPNELSTKNPGYNEISDQTNIPQFNGRDLSVLFFPPTQK